MFEFLRNKRMSGLLTVLLSGLVFSFITGCAGIQIKSDSELLSAPGFIVESAADYIAVKYPDKVAAYKSISEKVLNADTDDLTEKAFQEWINSLTEKINDPFLQRRARAVLESFEIDIDTNSIALDSGALRTARELVRKFAAQLEAE